MVSVIICSRAKHLLSAIAGNIADTIGVPYEIIAIDNSKNAYSICSAYNEGAGKAKFQYLCFVHEDVHFVTPAWGEKLVAHFNNNAETGLLGVAGGVYKTKMVSGWGQSEEGWPEHKRMNISHPFNGKLKKNYFNPYDETKSKVVTIDGVLMVTKKNIWQANKFDEKLLTGFHGYDLDFSLQVLQQNKIFVVYDIETEHNSGGSYNADWVMQLLKVHKKWEKKLPASVKGYTINTQSIYTDGWKRLRKNMRLFLQDNKSFTEGLKIFNALFSTLDGRPALPVLMKDYCVFLLGFLKQSVTKANKRLPVTND